MLQMMRQTTGKDPHGLNISSFFRALALLIVYVIGGMLFMHFAKGANGSEMCPNVSFWKEVPILVKVISYFFSILSHICNLLILSTKC